MFIIFVPFATSFASTLKSLKLTDNQKVFHKLLKDDETPLIICQGPSGTGKTMLSVLYALNEIKCKRKEGIILTRPTVLVDDNNLGSLPGNIDDKMTPLLQHVADIIGKEYGIIASLHNIMKDKQIQIIPLQYIRGHTFDNQIIIADECQNATEKQLKALMTRMGNNSKMIIMGDGDQSDLENGTNGLDTFLKRYNAYSQVHEDNNLIRTVMLTEEDIMRSDIVKQVLRIYNY